MNSVFKLVDKMEEKNSKIDALNLIGKENENR